MKRLIVLMLAACVLVGGCGEKPKEKENEENAFVEEVEKETVAGETETNSDAKEDNSEEEMETIDDFSYKYEGNKIDFHLFKGTSNQKVSLMATIACDEESGFSKMSYMQSVVDLSSIDPEVDFLVSLSVGEKTYGTLREGGEISMIGESLEENVSGSDEETQKTIDFSNELKKFLKANRIN